MTISKDATIHPSSAGSRRNVDYLAQDIPDEMAGHADLEANINHNDNNVVLFDVEESTTALGAAPSSPVDRAIDAVDDHDQDTYNEDDVQELHPVNVLVAVSVFEFFHIAFAYLGNE